MLDLLGYGEKLFKFLFLFNFFSLYCKIYTKIGNVNIHNVFVGQYRNIIYKQTKQPTLGHILKCLLLAGRRAHQGQRPLGLRKKAGPYGKMTHSFF